MALILYTTMAKISNTQFDGCLYYNGEDECPFNPRSLQYTYWRMEKIWVKITCQDETVEDNRLQEFLVDFPDGIDSIESIQTSLKATIYNQYCRFGGSKEGFEDYLITYLAKAN